MVNLVILLEPSSNEADKGGKDPLNEQNILSFLRRRSYEKGDRFKKFDYHVLIIVAIMDIRGFLTDSPMPPQRGSTSSEEDVIVRNEEPEAGAHPRCRPSSCFLSLGSWGFLVGPLDVLRRPFAQDSSFFSYGFWGSAEEVLVLSWFIIQNSIVL